MSNTHQYLLESSNDVSGKRHIIPLRESEVIVGRQEVRSTFISRKHAIFKWGEHGWTVTCIGQNNMVLDGHPIQRNVEYPVTLETEIKFTAQDEKIYRLRNLSGKVRHDSGSSTESHKKLKQENDGYQEAQDQLKEKEMFAQKLQEEILNLQMKLDEERKALENRLKEEEKKNRALEEKENELQRLAEEKANLEERQEAERLQLQRQLQETENIKEELRQMVDAKNNAIQAKEAEYRLAEEEKQRLKDQLEQERFTREEEEYKREEELMLVRAQQQSELKAALDSLKEEKEKLMAELASSIVGTSDEKKELVDSVSNVLEDEFQCAICNELFINAVSLNCSHTFCKYCLDRWKKKKLNCPSCRVPIKAESRSLIVDNFIEKIIPTLSEEMKKKRTEMVNERNAEMKAAEEAAAAAAVAAAAAADSRNRGRGRGRVRVNRGRGAQRTQRVLVYPANAINSLRGASSNPINNQSIMPGNNPQNFANNQHFIRIRLPSGDIRILQPIQGGVRIQLPPPGSSINPVTL